MIAEIERQPVDIPDDLPSFRRRFKDRFNSILRQLTQKLKWVAVLPKAVEEKTDIVNFEG